MPITDHELWACAHKVIEQHGTTAAGLHAAMRADELLEKGDREGCKVWTAILHRIEQLQAGGTALH